MQPNNNTRRQRRYVISIYTAIVMEYKSDGSCWSSCCFLFPHLHDRHGMEK